MTTIALFGATSGIAEQAARLYAAEGCALLLVGRDSQRLEDIADDLRVRGAIRVDCLVADLADPDGMKALVGRVADVMPNISTLWIAHGTLPDEAACRSDPALMESTLRINGLSPVLLTGYLLNDAGLSIDKLVVLSSVAGDIGRPSIATYGSAKAMVTAYFEALHRAADPSLPAIFLIKPGIVRTKMTAHLEHGALSAEAKVVANRIKRIAEQKSAGSYYVPPIWLLVMLIVRHMPAMILRRI